ncbi:MAG: hypothetical protein AAF581_04390 [Planctomycetota bacterium]
MSFADTIHKAIDAPVELVKGRWGQFDVIVDEQVVVSRKGGLIAKLVGRPWPTDEEVVAAVKRALPGAAD